MGISVRSRVCVLLVSLGACQFVGVRLHTHAHTHTHTHTQVGSMVGIAGAKQNKKVKNAQVSLDDP